MTARSSRRFLETRITRDFRVPASADDPEMLNGWRMIPVPPTNDPNWFVVDSSSDKKTLWGRWVTAEGRG